MSQHDFDALVQQFPEIIRQMPEIFTAHAFIRKLAEHNQSLYIEALYAYRGAPAPFQAVHGQLAIKLGALTEFVQRDGDETDSRDI